MADVNIISSEIVDDLAQLSEIEVALLMIELGKVEVGNA